MAITIQHGDASLAALLAGRAGEGIRKERQRAADLAFIQEVQRAQEAADRQRAFSIQNALGFQQDQAKLALDQQRLILGAQQAAADRAFNAQRLSAQIENQAAGREIQREQLGLQRQRMEADRAQQQRTLDYINSLPDSPQKQQIAAYYQATGKLPGIAVPQGEQSNTPALRSEFNRLRQQLSDAEKRIREAAYNPQDFDAILSGASESPNLPGVKAGFEARYQDAVRTRDAVQRRLQQLDQALAMGTQSLLGGTPVQLPLEAAAPPPARAGAAAGAPQTTPSGEVVISSQEEYDSLPSGTVYVDAMTGLRAVKP